MKPALSVLERIHEVKMSVVDLINKSGWRSVVRQRFNFVPRYGHLVEELMFDGSGLKISANW